MSPAVKHRQDRLSACSPQVATWGRVGPGSPCAGWETRSQLTGLHPNGLVVPSSAAAAFLMSLYIKDIWLGAQRPDTLLSHVRMVLNAAEESGGGDEEAIVRLCRDIAAMVPDT